MDIWQPIRGYEGLYEVSGDGAVRSMPRSGTGKRKVYGGKVLRSSANAKNGYAYVTLCDDIGGRKRVQARVHKLVLDAFVGSPPPGMQCRHLNGNRTDNRLANLAYGTPLENASDKNAHGTTSRGRQHGMVRLTASQVVEIRASYPARTQTALAVQFGVTQAAIWAIVHGKRWKAMTLEAMETAN